MYFAPQMGYPIGEMGTVFPGWCSGGVSLGFLNTFTKPSKKLSPFLAGFDFIWLDFGSDPVTPSLTSFASYRTQYGYGAANILGRVRPPDWKSRFIPFADVNMGPYCFWSIMNQTEPQLKLYDQVWKWGFNGGVAVGLDYYTGKKRQFSLMLRLVRQWGTSIEYIVRNSAKERNGQITYSTDYLRPNIFILEFGFQLHFRQGLKD